MGSGDECTLKKRGRYGRLAFPTVDGRSTYFAAIDSLHKRSIVDYRPSGTVDDQRLALKSVEKNGISHMVGRTVAIAGKRSMESDDIGLTGGIGKSGESCRPLGHCAQRVDTKHSHPQSLAPASYNGADISYTDHGQSHIAQPGAFDICGVYVKPKGFPVGQDGSKHILGDSRSVASGGIGHGDAACTTVVEIDMVGADCGSGYKPATGAFEQSGVTSGACTRNQRVGIAHRLGSNVLWSEIFDIGHAVEQALDKWDVFFNYKFHNDRKDINRAVIRDYHHRDILMWLQG